MLCVGQTIDLEQFYMPKIQSKEECDKYIGKRVRIFGFSDAEKREEVRRFKRWYYYEHDDGEYYTITKIKFGKQIKIGLVSEDGDRETIKIDNDGSRYEELSSCNIFFLWDDFEAYRKEQVGRVFRNSNNEDVAILQKIDIVPMGENVDPVFMLSLKSKINNEKFSCLLQDATNLCNKIGTIISNPKVKASYKVLGAYNDEDKNYKYVDTDADEYILGGMYFYKYKNMETGKVGSCPAKDIYTAPFENDFSGQYMAFLSEVEKPANSEYRYSKVLKEFFEDDIRKYWYNDSIIDIVFSGGNLGFKFSLQNVSNHSIKIIWDDASFVGLYGRTSRITHEGVGYLERNNSQPATVIIKNAKLEDIAIPTTYVDYLKDGGWSVLPMFPLKNGLYLEQEELKLGQVKLMLPIQIKDEINEYTFVFDVEYIYDHPERLKLEE